MCGTNGMLNVTAQLYAQSEVVQCGDCVLTDIYCLSKLPLSGLDLSIPKKMLPLPVKIKGPLPLLRVLFNKARKTIYSRLISQHLPSKQKTIHVNYE